MISDSNPTPALSHLKSKIENEKALGMVRSGAEEYLVIYESPSIILGAFLTPLMHMSSDVGCYVNQRGAPQRNCGFLKWETKATSFAHRDNMILLFSPRFIEIRSVSTGRLLQVIEGGDIRLLFSGPVLAPAHDNIILVMRGSRNDAHGVSEKLVELVKTVEIHGVDRERPPSQAWEHWDME